MLKPIRRLHYLLRQHRVESELTEEIEFHRAQKQSGLEQRGMAAGEASVATERALAT